MGKITRKENDMTQYKVTFVLADDLALPKAEIQTKEFVIAAASMDAAATACVAYGDRLGAPFRVTLVERGGKNARDNH